MIQKYTCVPICDYDVLVITNGTMSQVEDRLGKINSQTNDEIPLNSSITYLHTIKDLIEYLSFFKDKANNGKLEYGGKVVFMFFHGMEYIQDVLCDLIDHEHKCSITRDIPLAYHMLSMVDKEHSYNYNSRPVEILENAYFYFDSSIMSEDLDFTMVVTIANDILKKTNFMVGRIRGVYIDDKNLEGERAYAVSNLLRNYPNIETLELTSKEMVLMGHLVL